MIELFKKFCKYETDENGCLTKFSVVCPENFNYAYDVVDEIAKINPTKTALVWCDVEGNEKIVNFDELSKQSNQAANFLTKSGVKKGDRVMLILKRHYEYWYVLLALHKIGAIAVPATYMLCEDDIVYRVNNANISTIICAEDKAISKNVLMARPQCPSLQKLYNIREDREGFTRLDKKIMTEPDSFSRIENSSKETFILYFTSGTTGYPKAVTHSFSYPLAHIVTAKFWQNVTDDGLHLTLAETGWAKASWGKIYGQWLCGSAVMVYDFDTFNAEALMKVVSKYKVTTFCAPPTVYRFLVKNRLENYDFSSLKYAITAGEALNPEITSKFYEHTGLELKEGYGQTETTLLIATLTGCKSKRGSMGKPSPLYNIKLVDEDGNDVKVGEIGEIVVVPDNNGNCGLCTGYDNDENALVRAWKNGVYHTGDQAYCDEDGYYWYIARKDDIIKSSGYRIGPFEVESVLIQHDAVLECAITGVPDEQRGNVVKATIVLRNGFVGSDDLKKELQQFVKSKTAPYKYPRVIEFIDELPKTISGKIRHEAIRSKDNK